MVFQKPRQDGTEKNGHVAGAAESKASAQQKPAALRASVRGKQNASQSTSQSASTPQFKPPAPKPKRTAPQPIAQSTPVANHSRNAVSSPREPKRTKDSVKASAAAPLKTNAKLATVAPRACTSLLAATSDNKENAEYSPIADVPRAGTVPRESAAASKKPTEAASKVPPKTRVRL